MSGIEALLVLAVTLLALSAWSCWCESRRGDRYQQLMIEECVRADKAESRAAWRLLTSKERDFLDTLRRSGHLLPHGVKIIDGLLERLGGGR